MVSTLEALERYRVPHSAAKLMTSGFTNMFCRVAMVANMRKTCSNRPYQA